MVNPQKENGYIPIAREINQALISITLSDYERRVIYAIFDKTYGWNKKEDWISNSQICELTGIAKSNVSRTIKKLLEKNMIYKNGRKIGFQKYYDKWKIVPEKVVEKYKQKLPKQVTNDEIKKDEKLSKEITEVIHTDNKKLSKEITPILHKQYINILQKNIYTIFTHWNNNKIIVHEKNTYEPKIKSALKDYSVDEITAAITNYATILHSDEYYFNYKWTLGDFLKRGLDKFLDLEVAKNNYRSKQITPEPKKYVSAMMKELK